MDEYVRQRTSAGAKCTAALRDEARVAVLSSSDVVACTLIGAGIDSILALSENSQGAGAPRSKPIFDALLVDEATQACEPSTLVALQHVSHLCVLVGDQKQLPPTIKSIAATAGGLGVSLFERLLACGLPAPRWVSTAPVCQRAPRSPQQEHPRARSPAPIRLTIQYRMHPKIAEMPSSLFYDGELVTGDANMHLTPVSFPWPTLGMPVAFLPVDHGRECGDGLSQSNVAEAEAVCAAVAGLLDRGMDEAGVGVITFYAAQVRLLSKKLPAGVECNTVDAFQGREKEAIVLS